MVSGRRPTVRWGLGPVIGLCLGVAGGCIQFDPFQCQDDGDCVYDGRPGQCRLAEQTCIYPDESCPTRWSSADGECMSPAGASGGSDSDPSDGATSVASTSGEDSGDPTVDPPATTTATTGPVTTSTTSATTGDPVGCGGGPFNDLTGLGVVEASSIFSDNFHPFLAADGDYGSSWFSAGPESGGPSIFQWTVLDPHCFASVSITGNGLHDNPNFREDYGFENVVVRVYDESDALVFQQMASLGGTPDPPVLVQPDVWGVRIELELSEHESNDCGGFSELEIAGL